MVMHEEVNAEIYARLPYFDPKSMWPSPSATYFFFFFPEDFLSVSNSALASSNCLS